MAKSKPRLLSLLLFLVTFIFAAFAIQESRRQVTLPYQATDLSPTQSKLLIQGGEDNGATINTKIKKNNYPIIRRKMIGSTAPTCTYNECRGCRYRCRAEQVPVEGNDPINSAYHYRCVCHRHMEVVLEMGHKDPKAHMGELLESIHLHKMAKLSKSSYSSRKAMEDPIPHLSIYNNACKKTHHH